ncbi:MAG: Coenzyme F420 hydrogenase/dehydrogenase, beta subunit C-terminal domain [Prevotella sp.]|jgi:coenzyme F420-reducing hydrogenase beta subunit|nr:Coenzyme F420 hydrogenase/dehydrogenase, beta subunit C-terminal domain [Prevotella sp.]
MLGKDICTYNKCTGCFACVNACPKSCISLVEDEYGEIHPKVDTDVCIDCKLCQKTCPNNREIAFRYPSHCYAAWITNNDKRKICASGGIGTEFSEFVIKHGGIIFGSRYDEQLNPIITWTDSITELERFKGSRYVQSNVGEKTYKQVKEFLRTGKQVLYVGTPCQIAGLYGFLKKSYENLITIDLICHGVSPSKYLKEEIEYLTEKYGLKNVSDIRFRGNDGNNYRLTLWNKDRRKLFPRNNYRQKIFDEDFLEDCYLKGFLKGVSLRENCYSCNYARPERISDLTIGDFIGLGSKEPFPYSKANVSSITTNTQKGYEFLMKVAEGNDEFKIIERNYEERLAYRPSLMEPFKQDTRNPEFRKNYKKYGFSKAIRYVLYKDMLKEHHHLLFQRLIPIYLLKKIIKDIIGEKHYSSLKEVFGR